MKRKLLFLGLAALAAETALAVRAPQSAAFTKWQDSSMPQAGGWRPSPADLSHLGKSYRMRAEAKAAATSGRKRLMAADTIPAKWDSREHGWVTPIRNQNPYGTCWAHSTMAALETSFLRATNGAVTNDFSENHLATHDVGFAWRFDDGGNDDIAAALLTAWRDPLLEAQDPYPNASSTVDQPPACHVQDIVWIPGRTVSQTLSAEQMAATNEAIKRAVMEYGALSVNYYHYWDNYDDSNGAYYATEENLSGKGGGHAVTLIGWDDTYPVSNFVSGKRPPGPGAFLIKNSWGENNGDHGCLWISYYDQWLCSDPSTAYPMPEATNNYGRIYQYDPCGFIGRYNVLESGDDPSAPVTNWCANVFSSVATGIVEAVGFYALSAGTEYEIRAYANCASDPASGRLVSVQSGVSETAGYKTVRLAVPMAVGAQEKFAVAVGLKCLGTEHPLATEMSSYGYCTTSAAAGESWFSKDGTVWKDFQHFEPDGNFCIKAYTRFGADGDIPRELIASADPADETVRTRVGETNVFSVVARDDAGELEYSWSLSGVPVPGDGASLEFVPTKADHGSRVLSCRATDGVGVDLREWTLLINDELRSEDYDSLQAAVNAAIEGDRVQVAPGTYPSLEGPSVAIEIVAEEGAAATVIDAQGAGRCYYGGYNPSTVLRGFTLANAGIGDGYLGGGACYGTLVDCVITNCVASCGGGAYEALLVGCLVVGCRANAVQTPWGTRCGYGGGALDSTLVGCTVAGNAAECLGGGVDGGLYQDSYAEIYNSIVAGNTCADPNGGDDIWSDAVVYGDASWVGGDAGFADAENGDYRLKAGSPAIDTGINSYAVYYGMTYDLIGNARVFGAHVDLGCYEYCHVPAGWPVPPVEPDATPAEEAAAVSVALVDAGFPPSVASNVTSVADYSKINAWAEANGVTVVEHAASPTALLSPALDAAGLLPLTSDDIELSEFSIGTNATGRLSATMKLSLEAYDCLRVDAGLLKAAVGVVGSDTPGGSYSSKDLNVSVAPVPDGVELTATPPEGRPAYFLKGTVR